MGLDDRLRRVLRQQARKAGRRYAETKRAYREGREESERTPADPATFDLPADDGRARIVCRRHVEKRCVAIDTEGRPACFEADHPACEGCAEDVREGRVESW